MRWASSIIYLMSACGDKPLLNHRQRVTLKTAEDVRKTAMLEAPK
jgi:hypothetical protein